LQDELAANITLEQGKTIPDARGDVFRGLGEGAEHLCCQVTEALARSRISSLGAALHFCLAAIIVI